MASRAGLVLLLSLSLLLCLTLQGCALDDDALPGFDGALGDTAFLVNFGSPVHCEKVKITESSTQEPEGRESARRVRYYAVVNADTGAARGTWPATDLTATCNKERAPVGGTVWYAVPGTIGRCYEAEVNAVKPRAPVVSENDPFEYCLSFAGVAPGAQWEAVCVAAATLSLSPCELTMQYVPAPKPIPPKPKPKPVSDDTAKTKGESTTGGVRDDAITEVVARAPLAVAVGSTVYLVARECKEATLKEVTQVPGQEGARGYLYCVTMKSHLEPQCLPAEEIAKSRERCDSGLSLVSEADATSLEASDDGPDLPSNVLLQVGAKSASLQLHRSAPPFLQTGGKLVLPRHT